MMALVLFLVKNLHFGTFEFPFYAPIGPGECLLRYHAMPPTPGGGKDGYEPVPFQHRNERPLREGRDAEYTETLPKHTIHCDFAPRRRPLPAVCNPLAERTELPYSPQTTFAASSQSAPNYPTYPELPEQPLLLTSISGSCFNPSTTPTPLPCPSHGTSCAPHLGAIYPF